VAFACCWASTANASLTFVLPYVAAWGAAAAAACLQAHLCGILLKICDSRHNLCHVRVLLFWLLLAAGLALQMVPPSFVLLEAAA
jgi:hypothetical protein